jgi:cell division protein FtsI/penicillin-binding protein 2
LLKKLNSKKGYLKIYETTDWEVWEKYKKRRKEIIHKVITLAKEVIGIRTYDEDKIREYYQKTNTSTHATHGVNAKRPKLALALHYLHVLKWFGYTKAYKRFYPQGRYLANTVGFVSSNGTGRAGIELMENKYLYKGPIEIPYIRGLRGLKIIDQPIASKVKNLFVGDVYLTIDGTIQAILERVKNEIVQRWNPKKVVLILMDIHTGEIKGLAVYPDFDPNKPFRNWQEFLNSRNPAFMDVFEMGSVIKPFFCRYGPLQGLYKTRR